VGCRNRAAASDLLRIVVESPSGEGSRRLVPDLRGGMPGRGAHLHPDPECLALAERRKAFGRALRVEGLLDPTLVREQIGNRTSPSERADDQDERSMSQHR
jgi:predicted RNA-binding protein YlxR (DUF448 family)